MGKSRPLVKKQIMKYILCIAIGFLLYPMAMTLGKHIAIYIENRKELPYPDKPVSFVLDYLNTWHEENYERVCDMTSDQSKMLCEVHSPMTSLTMKDVELLKEEKTSADVYVEFETKFRDMGIQETYYWTFHLTRSKQESSWKMENYGY